MCFGLKASLLEEREKSCRRCEIILGRFIPTSTKIQVEICHHSHFKQTPDLDVFEKATTTSN